MVRSSVGQRVRALFVLALALAPLSTVHAANPYDPQWTGYPLPNVASNIAAMTPYAGGIAACGPAYFGTTTALGVALWDGIGWHPLGGGVNVNTGVAAAVVLGGQLIVCVGHPADFLNATESPRVYSWDGSAWTVLGSANGYVNSAVVQGSDLFVGGSFTSINGVAASRVARWDGSTWSALGAGLPAGNMVRALALHGADLIAAGTLPAYQGVARFDGANWTQVGAGLQNGASAAQVNALASDGTTLYATGNCTLSGGLAVTRTVAWNGTTWNSLAGATDAGKALALFGGHVVSTVSARPQLWDGSVWQAFGAPSMGSPYSFAQFGGDLYAYGSAGATFPGTPPTKADWFYRFDGSSWLPVQQAWAPGMKGIHGFPSCAAELNGALYVGGNFTYVGAEDHFVPTTLVAKWDGSAWTSMPNPGGSPYDLAIWRDSLVAVSQSPTRIWNGTSWRTLASGSTSQVGPFNGLAVHGDELYALGPLQYGSTQLRGIGRWTGSAWTTVGTGFGNAAFPGDGQVGTSYAGQLVVSGLFDDAGGSPARRIASWDGTAWHPLAGGLNQVASALAVHGTDLVVGGSFTEVDGDSITAAARWNGSQWSAMGTRARNIRTLRSHAGRLFAGGAFVDSAGQTVETAAVWSGDEWMPVSSGVHAIGGTLNALEPLGDDLYAVGNFNAFSGQPARNFAKLANASTLAVELGGHGTHVALAVSPWPNPSRGAVRLSVTLPAGGRARVTVHDVAGREVARLFDGERPAGRFDLEWAGRVAPGLYLATIEAAGQRATTRVVRLR